MDPNLSVLGSEPKSIALAFPTFSNYLHFNSKVWKLSKTALEVDLVLVYSYITDTYISAFNTLTVKWLKRLWKLVYTSFNKSKTDVLIVSNMGVSVLYLCTPLAAGLLKSGLKERAVFL